MDSAEIIRKGIRVVIAKQGISVARAAMKAQMHPQQIGRFMTGKDIRISSLDRFCNDGLGVDLSVVMAEGL